MGIFRDPMRDLFDPEEAVRRVPVIGSTGPDVENVIGTAYVSDTDIVIHIQNDTLIREVGPMLDMDFVKSFLLGVHYKPVEPKKEGG